MKDQISRLNLKTVLLCLPIVVLVILICVLFLDDSTAMWAMRVLRSNFFLEKGSSNIPDLLALVVTIVCGLFWGRYFLLRRHGSGADRQIQCCRVVGTAVPIAFLLKGPCKFVFGRVNARVWITSDVSDTFHWFQRGENYDSFPSGHMMVFAALFTALWLFYPRYRSIYAWLALILAAALVITVYHFISDVIAGAYLGLLITVLTTYAFKSINNKGIADML